jgi:hypothetical protein
MRFGVAVSPAVNRGFLDDPDDEQPLRHRVHGAGHDHPGLRPDRRYAEPAGGPPDGLLLDLTGWTPGEAATARRARTRGLTAHT